jgi:anti-sigma regulatory factor (Ser/Thr protein kinase)
VAFLEEQVDAEVAAAAALLVSELVSNVVIHAATDAEVSASITANRLRVEVADHSPALPVLRPPLTAPRPRYDGLGMVLLEELAHRWGVKRTPSGKVVWFELDVACRL